MNVSAIQSEVPLRARRRALGLSQQRVAELAKCSLSMVRLLAGGYVPWSSDVLRQVAKALDVAAPPQNDVDSATTESIAQAAQPGLRVVLLVARRLVRLQPFKRLADSFGRSLLAPGRRSWAFLLILVVQLFSNPVEVRRLSLGHPR